MSTKETKQVIEVTPEKVLYWMRLGAKKTKPLQHSIGSRNEACAMGCITRGIFEDLGYPIPGNYNFHYIQLIGVELRRPIENILYFFKVYKSKALDQINDGSSRERAIREFGQWVKREGDKVKAETVTITPK